MSKPMQNLSPPELYAFHFQNDEPEFYTMVPNIIDHLTYTIDNKGTKEIKRLSIFAKELYRVIRMIAPGGKTCWHSTESLAEIIGCSTGKVSEAKDELLMPMHQLDGSPLIIETKKTTIRRNENGHTFPVPLSHKMIVDIWSWNNAFMATRKFQNEYGRPGDSCGEPPEVGGSCGELPLLDGSSPGERNNNLSINNPLSLEQQPTADADSVVFKSYKKEKDKDMLPTDARKAFDWMISKKCDPVAALDMASKYSMEEIEKTSKYVEIQIKKNKHKNKPIDNIWGYFRTALTRRFWERKPA